MSITLGESFGCDNNNNNIRNNNNYIAKICDGDSAGDSDSAGDKTIKNYLSLIHISEPTRPY